MLRDHFERVIKVDNGEVVMRHIALLRNRLEGYGMKPMFVLLDNMRYLYLSAASTVRIMQDNYPGGIDRQFTITTPQIQFPDTIFDLHIIVTTGDTLKVLPSPKDMAYKAELVYELHAMAF